MMNPRLCAQKPKTQTSTEPPSILEKAGSAAARLQRAHRFVETAPGSSLLTVRRHNVTCALRRVLYTSVREIGDPRWILSLAGVTWAW